MAGNKAGAFVSDSRKALADSILTQMEQGNLLWEKPWDTGICLPHNPVSGVRYSGGNRLRLMLAAMDRGYTDARFVTFVQASKEGWKVRKGEKGFLCEKWIYEKLTEVENPDTHKKEKIVVPLAHPAVSYFYVYNASQIEGMPKQTVQASKEEQDITEMLIRASPCKVQESAQERSGYSLSLDCIFMPPRTAFKTPADFIKTLSHEMIHSTGHPDRLDRNMARTFGTSDYAKEELRAEIGAVFLAADLGLATGGHHLENHAAYVQSWMKVLRNNPDELFAAASDAEKAARYIEERYRMPAREKACGSGRRTASEPSKNELIEGRLFMKSQKIQKTFHERKQAYRFLTVFLLSFFFVTVFTASPVYASYTGWLTGVENFINTLFSFITLVGKGLLGWALFEVATALFSHDTSQVPQGLRRIGGGAILVFVEPIVASIAATPTP